MTKQAIRKQRRAKRERQKFISRVIVFISAAFIVGVIGYLGWNAAKPLEGEEVEIMANALGHVPVDELPEYSTNPPTSGPHFSTPLEAGFYNSLDEMPPNSDGYLVHNLEHGYVVFWYNCDLVDAAACSQLKSDIQGVMEAYQGYKLVAVPRNSIDTPLVLTSWGQLARFDQFDERSVTDFIDRNHNQSPEPQAD